MKYIFIAFLFVAAAYIGMTAGTQPSDLDAFEKCVEEKYGMSSAEWYQLTGEEPKCN